VSNQGDEMMDCDLPTLIEIKLFSSTFGKILFVLLQPLFYSFRPILILPKAICFLEVVNLLTQISFDCAIIYFFGFKSLIYLLLGTLLGLGLHPIAGLFKFFSFLYSGVFIASPNGEKTDVCKCLYDNPGTLNNQLCSKA
jgi:sphingolipid delta-4 desaturase